MILTKLHPNQRFLGGTPETQLRKIIKGEISEKRGFFGKIFSRRLRSREISPFLSNFSPILGGGAKPDFAPLTRHWGGGRHLPPFAPKSCVSGGPPNLWSFRYPNHSCFIAFLSNNFSKMWSFRSEIFSKISQNFQRKFLNLFQNQKNNHFSIQNSSK